jgi:hypothetical protein
MLADDFPVRSYRQQCPQRETGLKVKFDFSQSCRRKFRQTIPYMRSTEKAGDFIVSIKAEKLDFGLNVGKWTARFAISKFGKVLYHGVILNPVDSEIDAERAAAGEACRVLCNGAKLLY